MRAYLASAYTAHPHGPDAAWKDAVRAAVRVSLAYNVPLSDAHGGWQDYPVLWSPVIVGHVRHGKDWPWRDAMRWCLSNMRAGKFSHLIVARVPGVDRSEGVKAEIREAERLGLTIVVEA